MSESDSEIDIDIVGVAEPLPPRQASTRRSASSLPSSSLAGDIISSLSEESESDARSRASQLGPRKRARTSLSAARESATPTTPPPQQQPSSRSRQTRQKGQKDLYTTLSRGLDFFTKRDSYGIFLEPVDTAEVTTYPALISSPMDFHTMRNKLRARAYRSFAEFEADFRQVIANCKMFNHDAGNPFYQQAERLEAWASNWFDKERNHDYFVEDDPAAAVTAGAQRPSGADGFDLQQYMGRSTRRAAVATRSTAIAAAVAAEAERDTDSMWQPRSAATRRAPPIIFHFAANGSLLPTSNMTVPTQPEDRGDLWSSGPLLLADSTDPSDSRFAMGLFDLAAFDAASPDGQGDLFEAYESSVRQFAQGMPPRIARLIQSRLAATVQ